MPGKTTIQVSVEVKEQLENLGGKKDTYDTIIRRLLLCWARESRKK